MNLSDLNLCRRQLEFYRSTKMDYIQIPNIEIAASRIGLGTWAIGGSLWGGTDKRESIDTILEALQLGVNIIDTAPAYGKGESEKIVGEALKEYGHRDKVIVVTKFGLNQQGEGVFRDLRKVSILKEVEDSLKRLQIDHIDLFQAHWPDSKTPLSELSEALNQLIKQGKILAAGVCNFTIEQMEELKKTLPLASAQFPFNIFEQESSNVLNYTKKTGLVSLGYGAICRGLLSGKMKKGQQFSKEDLRGGMDPKFKEPVFSEYINAVEKLDEWSQHKYKKPVLSLALRWVLDKGIDISLWGARRPDQVKNLNEAFGWDLNEEDFKEIENIVKENVKHPASLSFMAPPERE